jgi:hypothetical protein
MHRPAIRFEDPEGETDMVIEKLVLNISKDP